MNVSMPQFVCPDLTADTEPAQEIPGCARSTFVEKHGIRNERFLDLSEVIEIIKPDRVSGPATGLLSGISIDTRKPAGEDYLFWAIKGRHFNGNDFVEQALAAGVKGAVVSRADLLDRPLPEGTTLMLVPDTLVALQQVGIILSTSIHVSGHRRDRKQWQDARQGDACGNPLSGKEHVPFSAFVQHPGRSSARPSRDEART